MILGFDIRSLFGSKTGIGVYSYNLIQCLRYFDENDVLKLYSCSGFSGKTKVSNPFAGDPKVLLFPPLRIPNYLLHMGWNYLSMPKIESIIGEVDLVHGLSYVLPRSRKATKVLTVYDLTFMLVPQTHPFSRQTFLPEFVKRSVRDADAIIAISEATKQDILNAFSVSEQKITVTHLGVDHSTFNMHSPWEAVERVKRKFCITKDYIFYLGTIEPRKNVDLLLKAFQLLKERTKKDFQLVLSGKVGWKVELLMKVVHAMVKSGEVVYTGYISEQEAACLYSGATVFVYPSQYEGFGIPVLEAMACGCPVIASNSSSLPEVVGDAGILVEPNNVEALVEAIFTVLHDEEFRRVLKEKGVQRASQFTWERTARTTRDLYVSLLKG